MINKKICLLGAFAVGKTSLVRRFVQGIYSEKYLTTVGVQISKKVVCLHESDVTLLIWDTVGDDDVSKQRLSYLRGAAGIILVADGTRLYTLETTVKLYERAIELLGEVPFVFLINKEDLSSDWKLNDEFINRLRDKGWPVATTSALTGAGVEDAFLRLAKKMVES